MNWEHANLMKDIFRVIFIVFYFTLFLAVGHQKAEISGQTADCSGGESLQRAKSFSMRLAEADHRYRCTWRTDILPPLQAFYP